MDDPELITSKEESEEESNENSSEVKEPNDETLWNFIKCRKKILIL